MKKLLCGLFLSAALVFGQSSSSPVPDWHFFSPTIIGLTIGNVKCYFWHFLNQPLNGTTNDKEIGCYQGTQLKMASVSTDDTDLLGSYVFPVPARSGVDQVSITWQLITQYPSGKIVYHIVYSVNQGTEIVQNGTF